MAELAGTQVQRLVALVAWMSQRDTGRPGALPRCRARPRRARGAAAGRPAGAHRPPTDSYKPWLSSLSVALVANGFTLSSRGAFRRPLRFSHDEALALLVGLAGLRGAGALAGKLGAGFAARATSHRGGAQLGHGTDAGRAGGAAARSSAGPGTSDARWSSATAAAGVSPRAGSCIRTRWCRRDARGTWWPGASGPAPRGTSGWSGCWGRGHSRRASSRGRSFAG